jgi:hypothetical protein
MPLIEEQSVALAFAKQSIKGCEKFFEAAMGYGNVPSMDDFESIDMNPGPLDRCDRFIATLRDIAENLTRFVEEKRRVMDAAIEREKKNSLPLGARTAKPKKASL